MVISLSNKIDKVLILDNADNCLDPLTIVKSFGFWTRLETPTPLSTSSNISVLVNHFPISIKTFIASSILTEIYSWHQMQFHKSFLLILVCLN